MSSAILIYSKNQDLKVFAIHAELMRKNQVLSLVDNYNFATIADSLNFEITENALYYVFVVLDPKGCGICTGEADLWSRIDLLDNISVISIPFHQDKIELQNFYINKKLNIPFIYGYRESDFEEFSKYRLPIKIFTDKEFNVISIDQSRLDEESKNNYYQYIKSYPNLIARYF